MDITTIIGIITIAVTFILGLLAKKSKWISNHLIPLQNLIIGIIACIVIVLLIVNNLDTTPPKYVPTANPNA